MTEFKPQTTGIGSNRSATDPQPMHIKNRFDVQFFGSIPIDGLQNVLNHYYLEIFRNAVQFYLGEVKPAALNLRIRKTRTYCVQNGMFEIRYYGLGLWSFSSNDLNHIQNMVDHFFILRLFFASHQDIGHWESLKIAKI